MMIYADTSALVKLFVTEANSVATRVAFQDARALGTGLLTRAELGAALARGARRGILSEDEAQTARQWLRRVWPTWSHVMMNADLVSRAESLAWDYKLRGYDAVHLASALSWQSQIGHPVAMATFDQELWDAASLAGLGVWPDTAPAGR
jgi:uncharacterized protein